MLSNNIVVLGEFGYHKPFLDMGFSTSILPHSLDRESGPRYQKHQDPVAVVFTGGTDVNPYLYGESKLRSTNSPDCNRDSFEAEVYDWCIEFNIPMIGICRGSQFLTVMNGGRLIQDVKNHCRDHYMRINKSPFPESSILVTSTHHQMMYPFEIEHKLLAWSEVNLSEGHYKTGSNVFKPGLKLEPEVVYYPQSNSLAVQYHPEYMEKNEQGYLYFTYLVNKLLSAEI